MVEAFSLNGVNYSLNEKTVKDCFWKLMKTRTITEKKVPRRGCFALFSGRWPTAFGEMCFQYRRAR